MKNRELRREIAGCLRVTGPVESHLLRLRASAWPDWESSLNWLNLSGLALVFWERLQKRGAEDVVPSPVRAILAASRADHRHRVAAMLKEFESLNFQLARAGVEYAAWKGFALIPEYCPDANLRPSYDYDYLIPPASWGRAQEVLQAAGYFRKPESHGRQQVTYLPKEFRRGASLPPETLYRANLPRKVELHRSPWEDADFPLPISIPRFQRVQRSWQGLTFYALDAHDAFVFQALHAFQHILHNWCRLGWLWEIAYFVEGRSRDPLFWKALQERWEGNQALNEIVGLVTLLASRLFGATLPAPADGQFAPTPRSPLVQWVDRYGIRSALDNFAENKQALLLYRELVGDKRIWREIRRRRLLPLHRPNRLDGAVASRYSLFPRRFRQARYTLGRFIHHVAGAVTYAWEAWRWKRLRRLHSETVLR